MNRRGGACALSFFALAMAQAPTPAGAAEETVEVMGMAAIVNDDVAAARDRALDDAKRKAVEQVAGAQVSAESITRNFQLVEEQIYARASGYVRTYQILGEHKEEGVYQVRLSAKVDKSAVAEHLDLIMKERPRVIVMVAEQNVGGEGYSYWWGRSGMVADMDILQTTLIDRWQARGFKFVDPGSLMGTIKARPALHKPSLDDNAILSLSREADADVAIVGKVMVTDAGPVMEGVKMRAYNAVGSLRVLNVDTGEILAVADESGTAHNIEPNIGGRAAIKALGKKLSDILESKIVGRWTKESVNAREIEVEIEGVTGGKMIDKVVSGFREHLRGVESVRVRRRAKGRAFFSVKVRATAIDFAKDIENSKLPEVELEVASVSKARIQLKVVK